MADPDLKELFKEAAEIASVVPESMREAAFNRAVDALQVKHGLSPKKNARKGGASSTSKADADEEQILVQSLIENLDSTAHSEILSATKVLDRALYLLRAAKDDLGIDGLTTGQIATVLTEKFRVSTKSNPVNMALADRGDLVDRIPKGRAFVYRLMAPGEAYLKSAVTSTSASDGSEGGVSGGPAKKRRKVTGSKGHTAPKGANGKAPKQARIKSGRPGPKAVVEEVIANGFFAEPKTIGDLQEHLERNRGHRYKATDLSPTLVRLLRAGILERERDDNAQYRYKSR